MVNHKRVARLMRAAGISGRHLRKAKRITVQDAPAPKAPDLLERDFTAPRVRWCGDITYVATRQAAPRMDPPLPGVARESSWPPSQSASPMPQAPWPVSDTGQAASAQFAVAHDRPPDRGCGGAVRRPVNSTLHIRCDRPLTASYFIVNFSPDVSQFTTNTDRMTEALCPIA
ncbi:hypothetical protein ACFXJ5_08630 [Streptomyces sp. NPDC059373]